MPKEWAWRPRGWRVSWVLSSEDGAQAHLEFALLARAGGGDEYGVVAGDGAHHLGPAGRVDGHGHVLCGADGRLQYHEVAACRLQRVDELLEGRKIALRVHRGCGQHIPVPLLRHTQLAQIAVHARLGRSDPGLAQHGNQLGLSSDDLFAYELREQRPAGGRTGIAIVGLKSGVDHARTLHKFARSLHKNAEPVNGVSPRRGADRRLGRPGLVIYGKYSLRLVTCRSK